MKFPKYSDDYFPKGDILVRPEDLVGGPFSSAHLADPEFLWPSGVVEYKFYKTFPRWVLDFQESIWSVQSLRKHKKLVEKAMKYITNRTSCVTFVPTTSFINYVTIITGPNCSSEVGMRGGQQLLYLNAGCFRRGLIVPVHELMHTLGFVHEHNRTLVLTGS